MQDIVELYKHFERFNKNTDQELRLHIFPSLNLKQYKRHYDGNELIGFTNWAFVSDNALHEFKKTGKLENKDWNSGSNLLFVEFVAKKNIRQIFKWCIEEASKFIGLKKEFTWARIQNDKVKRIVKRNR